MTPGLAIRIAIVAALTAATAGCDPCTGVSGCRVSDRIVVDGRVLTSLSGQPSRNVDITLTIDRGDQVATATTRTDDDGLFSVSVPGPQIPRTVRLGVTAAGRHGYVVDSVPCLPTNRYGDGCVLRPLVEDPILPIYHFRYRYDPDRRIENALITFTRTAGAELTGLRGSESFWVRSDTGGVAQVFPFTVFATSLEPVIGTLVVELPAPLGVIVRPGFAATATPQFGDRPIVIQLIGPSLRYVLTFADSATGSPVRGVSVSFQRTGGIAAFPASFTVASDSLGRAELPLRAPIAGSVTGEVTIRAPGVATPASGGAFTLATFEADSAVVAGRWRIGQTGVPYRVTPP